MPEEGADHPSKIPLAFAAGDILESAKETLVRVKSRAGLSATVLLSPKAVTYC